MKDQKVLEAAFHCWKHDVCRQRKMQRKQQQEANITKKQDEKEEHKKRSIAGMKKDTDSEDDVENPGKGDSTVLFLKLKFV